MCPVVRGSSDAYFLAKLEITDEIRPTTAVERVVRIRSIRCAADSRPYSK